MIVALAPCAFGPSALHNPDYGRSGTTLWDNSVGQRVGQGGTLSNNPWLEGLNVVPGGGQSPAGTTGGTTITPGQRLIWTESPPDKSGLDFE